MGRQIPAPFRLPIVEEKGGEAQGQSVLEIEWVLRLVPGRRLVALARWGDRLVIVKLFFHAGQWKRHMLRDRNGVNLLRQSGVPTPELLLETTTTDGKGGVLIIEYLQQGTSLSSLLEAAVNEADIDEVINLAVKTIALCHQAGLWQRDIHLDNFMLAAGVVYLLDGGDIKAEERLDNKISRQNLALFFAQFPAIFDEKASVHLDQYQIHRTEPVDVKLGSFRNEIRQARKSRIAKFERKLFRSTTANRSERSTSKFYVHDRSIHSPELDRFIKDPDSFIHQDKLLKQGNSSTVALVEIDGREFVLKRYNIKSFWHGLSRMMRPSRAHHSWRNASVLEMLGVATPHPYLFLEERIFWVFRSRAYFLCEYIAAQDVGTAWGMQGASEEADEGWNRTGNEEVVELFRQFLKLMNDYQISHGDMKATNFIIRDKQLFVLDLDAMKRHQSQGAFAQKFAADLARFRKNWIGGPLEPLVDLMIEEIELLPSG